MAAADTEDSLVIDDPVKRITVMGALMLPVAIYVVDLTIVSVALPSMQGGFSATADEITWVVTSYIIATAVLTPAVAPVAARVGRKRLLLVSIALFTAASLLCGLAESIAQEVAFRILQGAAAAPFLPICHGIILDIYPKRLFGMVNAVFGMGVLVAQILGPGLGGWLVDAYSWPWIFYINIPIGAVAVALIVWLVPGHNPTALKRFDWFGYVALVVAIACLQLVLDRGEHLGWFDSPEIVIETIVGGFAFYLFLAHSLTATHSYPDREILADRNMALAFFAMFVYGILTYWPLVLVPLLLYNQAGYPILTIGLLMSMRGLGAFISMGIAGRLEGRMDTRPLMFAGYLMLAVTAWGMSRWTLEVTPWEVIWTGMVFGLGVGFAWVPLGTAAFATLPARHRTEASSVVNLLRSLGTALGVSAVVSILTVSTRVNHAILAEHVVGARLERIAEMTGLEGAAALAAVEAEIGRQAFMIAFTNASWAMMWVALAVSPMAFLLRRTPETAAGRPSPVTD